MKKCPSCNNDISEEAKFCPYCGKPVPENAGERFCPNCGSKIDGDPSFCPSCGENLRAAKGSKEEETVLKAVGALEDEVDSALGSSGKKGRSSLVSERNFVVWILISIFTCGIGALVWLGFLVNDLIEEFPDSRWKTSGVAVVLLHFVTCGIYSLYAYYKMSEKLEGEGIMTWLSVVLGLFLSPIAALAYIQYYLNNRIKGK